MIQKGPYSTAQDFPSRKFEGHGRFSGGKIFLRGQGEILNRELSSRIESETQEPSAGR